MPEPSHIKILSRTFGIARFWPNLGLASLRKDEKDAKDGKDAKDAEPLSAFSKVVKEIVSYRSLALSIECECFWRRVT